MEEKVLSELEVVLAELELLVIRLKNALEYIRQKQMEELTKQGN